MTEKKVEKLSDELCEAVLATIGKKFNEAPEHVRGAVILLASDDPSPGIFGMGLGFMVRPLEHEVYSYAGTIVRKWVRDIIK